MRALSLQAQRLFALVRANAVDEISALLAADPSLAAARDDAGGTPLMLACSAGRRRLTKLLVRAGCPLDAQNQRGQTALHLAVGFGHAALADYLVACGADRQRVNAYGLGPFDGLVRK